MTGGSMKLLDVNENRNTRVRPYDDEEVARMKAYPQENFRRIMNPLAWFVESGCNSNMYRIKGFTIGELETYDIYHVNHFLQTTKSQGIVSLEYGRKAREMYPNFEQYIKVKETEGLKSAKKYWEDILEMQKIAVSEMKKHGGIDYVRAQEKQEEFENLIKNIDTWLADVDAETEVKTVEKVSLTRPSKKKSKSEKDSKTVGA